MSLMALALLEQKRCCLCNKNNRLSFSILPLVAKASQSQHIVMISHAYQWHIKDLWHLWLTSSHYCYRNRDPDCQEQRLCWSRQVFRWIRNFKEPPAIDDRRSQSFSCLFWGLEMPGTSENLESSGFELYKGISRDSNCHFLKQPLTVTILKLFLMETIENCISKSVQPLCNQATTNGQAPGATL